METRKKINVTLLKKSKFASDFKRLNMKVFFIIFRAIRHDYSIAYKKKSLTRFKIYYDSFPFFIGTNILANYFFPFNFYFCSFIVF